MMTQDMLKTREAVSALADGQLRGHEFARAVEAVSQDVDARATWHAYHLVGDVLRSGEAATGREDMAFVARLQLRLQREEPVVQTGSQTEIAPDLIAAYAMNTRAKGQNGTQFASANASRFRWKMVAGLASLTAVAVVGWGVVNGLTSSAPAVLAVAPVAAPADAATVASATPVVEPPQVMIRDPRLDELLAAHKQFGGTSALQMPAGFLRNATFEVPNR